MFEENSVEKEAIGVKWSNVPDEERVKLLDMYYDHLVSSKIAMVSVSGFNTNARTLFLLMSLALLLAILQVDNRTIVTSLLSFQFLKTMFSKLIETKTVQSAKEMQDKLRKALQRAAKLEG